IPLLGCDVYGDGEDPGILKGHESLGVHRVQCLCFSGVFGSAVIFFPRPVSSRREDPPTQTAYAGVPLGFDDLTGISVGQHTLGVHPYPERPSLGVKTTCL
ncbi:hypothetical protein BaRGS_00000914, partial [Batillaria attramentaria]